MTYASPRSRAKPAGVDVTLRGVDRPEALNGLGSVEHFAPAQGAAADLPQVDPEDATAKALEYVHASTNPEQNCANCQLYTGEAGAEWGPCAIFPGKGVAAKGWCKSWIKKAG